MRLRYTLPALADLNAILDHIETQSQRAIRPACRARSEPSSRVSHVLLAKFCNDQRLSRVPYSHALLSTVFSYVAPGTTMSHLTVHS